MKEVMKTIDQANGLLSKMLVNGDNVDLLAAARQALRVAYGRLEELNRKEVMKTIDQAHGLLSQMLVNGDNVDLLAAARQALRVAYGRLEKLNRKGVAEGGSDDRQPAEDAV